MGILSQTSAIVRYAVQGALEPPIIDAATAGLKSHVIVDIDDDPQDMSIGWTSRRDPFAPDFNDSSFVVGPYFIFSLRIDKKTIPPRIVKKHVDAAVAKRLADTGRSHLSRQEKADIRDAVLQNLCLRIPASPHVYDVIWHPEDGWLWFFSTQKAANETLETLFAKSFANMSLLRLFPYTIANLKVGLDDGGKDLLNRLAPARISE